MTVGEKIENVVGKNAIRLSNTDCVVLAFTREEWFKEWDQEKFMQGASSCLMCERPLGSDYEIIKKHENQEPILDKPHIKGDYYYGFKNGLRTAKWRYDKIKAEIERQEKWLMNAGYTACNVDIAFDSIKSVIAEESDEE